MRPSREQGRVAIEALARLAFPLRTEMSVEASCWPGLPFVTAWDVRVDVGGQVVRASGFLGDVLAELAARIEVT